MTLETILDGMPGDLIPLAAFRWLAKHAPGELDHGAGCFATADMFSLEAEAVPGEAAPMFSTHVLWFHPQTGE